jgi:PTS system nitrogen regulatory IIA component
MTTILTINDVAQKLKMSASTIYKYAERGKIPSIKIGSSLRFTEDQINHFLAQCINEIKPDTEIKLTDEN